MQGRGTGFAIPIPDVPFTRFGSAVVAGAALLLACAMGAYARQDSATAAAPQVFEVVVRRYGFEPARIEVREGAHVRLLVRSADGIHGVGIRPFDVSTTVPRGNTPVTIDFVADAPGTYEILCSEYCGSGHDAMTGTLIVHAAAR